MQGCLSLGCSVPTTSAKVDLQSNGLACPDETGRASWNTEKTVNWVVGTHRRSECQLCQSDEPPSGFHPVNHFVSGISLPGPLNYICTNLSYKRMFRAEAHIGCWHILILNPICLSLELIPLMSQTIHLSCEKKDNCVINQNNTLLCTTYNCTSPLQKSIKIKNK